VFHSAEGYLAIIKDFYEAYIIYQFLSFCISVLGRGDREAVIDLLARHADHLSPPFRFTAWCNPNPWGDNHRELARAVLLQCQLFAMQFVFLRPLTTTAMFVLDKVQYYGPTGNQMDYRSPQFYLVGVQNLSVFIAFTGLLKFYHAVDKDLAWCRPFAKFLCIKGVVFMTFWQGLAISILASTTDVGGNDADEWAKSAQNFLVCLEMLLFSIAHFYTFPTEEWEEGYRAKQEQGAFGDSIALGDFMSDLKLLLRSSSKKKKKKKKSKSIAKTIPEGKELDDDDSSMGDVTTRTESDLEEGVEVELDMSTSSANAEEEEGIVKRATLRLLESNILDEDDWQAIGEEELAVATKVKRSSQKHLLPEPEEKESSGSITGSIPEEPDLSYMGKKKESPSPPSSDTPPTETTGLLSGTRGSGMDEKKDDSNQTGEELHGDAEPASRVPESPTGDEGGEDISPNSTMFSEDTEEETDETESDAQEADTTQEAAEGSNETESDAHEANTPQESAEGSNDQLGSMPTGDTVLFPGSSSMRAPSDEFESDEVTQVEEEPMLRPSIFTTVAAIASRSTSPVPPSEPPPPIPEGEDSTNAEGDIAARSASPVPPSEPPPPIPGGEDTTNAEGDMSK